MVFLRLRTIWWSSLTDARRKSRMGAVESCCGKRRPDDLPSMPTKPVSALGNQYVTFNPESPEIFKMKQRVWSSHQPFDVKDITNNDWFKIEGKDAQVSTWLICVVHGSSQAMPS